MNMIFQTYISALLADATYALGKPNQGDLTGATSNKVIAKRLRNKCPVNLKSVYFIDIREII